MNCATDVMPMVSHYDMTTIVAFAALVGVAYVIGRLRAL